MQIGVILIIWGEQEEERGGVARDEVRYGMASVCPRGLMDKASAS